MRNDTHRASLGAILTIITGKMVSPLDEWYSLQDFLAGRSLMTHERTVGADRQAAALLAQFPRLAEVEAPEFAPDEHGSKEASVHAWVDAVAKHVGWTEATVRPAPNCEVDPGEAFDLVLGVKGD